MALSVGLKYLSVPAIDRVRITGIALAALAAGLVLVVTRPAPQTPVLIASADLMPGQQLSADGVSVRWVADATGMVEGVSLGELEEWSVRTRIVAGEPLVPSLLQPPELRTAPNVVALSLAPSAAVLGDLAAGDLVDVYRTTSATLASPATTELIAADVYVVEARFDPDALSGASVDLLLAVDDALARTIVAADREGSIDLVRVAP